MSVHQSAQPPHNNRPDNQADWLEEAKKLMEWERYDDPTLLEYLRYYKSGSIGEVHIEAAITTKIAEERLDEAKHYCDKGHYHDKDRDLAMLPSERIAELEAGLKGDK